MRLSSELYHTCRNTLLKCSEFDSNFSLQSVFVTDELRPFRYGLPAATSKSERVDRCLAFLVDKHLSDGRPILPVLLVTLRDRYQPRDALHDELARLAKVIYPDFERHLVSEKDSPSGSIVTGALRQQLQRLDDIDLDALCMDYFPTVYDRFSRGLRRDEKINLLLDHCRRHTKAATRLATLLE